MLPDLFPDAPVMFVAHNFDSISAYEKCKRNGGEAQSFFWRTLLAYLSQASIRPERCFFTNALMGLKPGNAIGPMPAVPGYYDECQAFLKRQIEIVDPSLIVTLGQKARARVTNLQTTVPSVGLLHPSARELKPLTTRCSFIEREAEVLSKAYESARRNFDL
jgi:uracil-DNA glycosylase